MDFKIVILVVYFHGILDGCKLFILLWEQNMTLIFLKVIS